MMDENQDFTEEFSLEDILNEFRDPVDEAEETEAVPQEAPVEPAQEAVTEEAAVQETPAEEPAAPSAEESAEPEDAAASLSDATVEFTPLPGVQESTLSDNTITYPAFNTAEAEEPVSEEATLRLDDLSAVLETPAETPAAAQQTAEITAEEAEQVEQAAKKPGPIPFPSRSKLQELKKKIIAGPEKRYYDLSEVGLGKVQIGILINLLIVVLCVATTTLFTMGLVPENRLRLVIFSQVLAMLVSALLGSQQLLDGLGDLFRPRFTINTLLSVNFIVCCVDAVFCLKELRVPCCSVFTLEMTFALLARYHRRSMEMSQMDTLRKAAHLHSIVKEPNFYNGRPGVLRGDGDVDDFLDTYQKTSGPEKLQSVYAFISLILCLGIAAVAGMRHTPSLAVQVLSTSLLVAVPSSFFIALTRPAALLERRLHLVGSVICGWQGVKKLCGKAVFPVRDLDLFPSGSTKLNGIKFYGKRSPEEVLAFTTSLIAVTDSGLIGIFRNMLKSRGVTEYPVSNFIDYGAGGIGGEVRGEAVLLGSLEFMEEMGIDVPEGTMVSQAVYAAVDGELSAVIAISYAKMRSSSAGLISLCGFRKAVPLMLTADFMLTEEFIRQKFGIKTRRMVFPEKEERAELSQRKPDPTAEVLALATRADLASIVYPITGSAALRTSCRVGVAVHMIGGILGMLIMLALAYLGSTQLLTPTHVLLYQLVWMVPGFLVTEWTRAI